MKTEEDDVPTFTAWVTEYALTRGVYTVTAAWCDEVGGMIRNVGGKRYRNIYHPSEYVLDEGAARVRFEALRTKKLASLDKARKKTANLEFSVRDLRLPDDQETP